MIQLYKAENKSFECNGDMTLIPSKATVRGKLKLNIRLTKKNVGDI